MSETRGVTSGTILRTRFNVAMVMEHAFRRAGYSSQRISSEWLDIAQRLLWLMLSEYVNFGFPLWTRQQLPLGMTIGSPTVPTPYGTVDVIHVYWRSFSAYRGPATLSTGEDASLLVGGAATDDVGIQGPNPGVIVAFDSENTVTSIGVLPAFSTGWLTDGSGNPILDGYGNPIHATPSSYTASLQVMVSDDGITWINAKTLPETTFQAGQWSYFDLDPTITTSYIQIMLPADTGWMLSQVNFVLPNWTQYNLGKENIDDYYNLPNLAYSGSQPNIAYVDRQQDQPVIKIWPVPNSQAFYNGTIVSLQKRYIEDPGSLTNTLEIPARWFEGVTSRLGVRLMDELPPVIEPGQQPPNPQERMARRQSLEAAAIKAEAGFWSEERDLSPMKIIPNISAYTR